MNLPISEDERLGNQSAVWRLIRKYVWKLSHSRTEFKSQEEKNGWYDAFHALERLCNKKPALGTKTPPRKVGKAIKTCYTGGMGGYDPELDEGFGN